MALAIIAAWGSTVLPRDITLLMPVAVAVLAAVLRCPWIAALLLVMSVPVQEVGAAQAGGAALTATRACLMLALSAIAIWLTVNRQRLVVSRTLIPFVALLAVMVASAHVARDVRASAAELARWMIAFAALVIFLQFVSSGSELRATVFAGAIVAAAALESLYGISQSLRDAGPASFAIDSGLSRAFGTFGRPNTFAGCLEFGLFPAIWLGWHYLRRAARHVPRYRLVRQRGYVESRVERRAVLVPGVVAFGFLGCAAIIAAGIAFSYSRGAWLGVAAAATVTLALYGPITRVALLIAFSLAGIVVLGAFSGVIPVSIGSRLASIADAARPFDAASATITEDNFSTVERMAHWQAGWHMFEDHPALGVGVGNFNSRYPDYYVREEFRVSRGHAHNYYIHTLAETGMLGLLAYLALVLTFVALAFIVILSPNPGFPRALALGVLGTMVSVGVHNAFEDLHVLNLGILFSATWCLVLAAHRGARGRGPQTATTVGDLNDVEYSAA